MRVTCDQQISKRPNDQRPNPKTKKITFPASEELFANKHLFNRPQMEKKYKKNMRININHHMHTAVLLLKPSDI